MQRGEEEGTVPIWNVDKNRANRGKKCMPTRSLCVGHVIVIILFIQRDVSVSSFCQQTRSLKYQKNLQFSNGLIRLPHAFFTSKRDGKEERGEFGWYFSLF